jgi:hypothetical protein
VDSSCARVSTQAPHAFARRLNFHCLPVTLPTAEQVFFFLRTGAFALSPSSIKEELSDKYRRAVRRIGDVASADVTLTDDDVLFFTQVPHAAPTMSAFSYECMRL